MSEALTTILDLDEIVKKVVGVVEASLKVENITIMLKEGEDKYLSYGSDGISSKELKLTADDPIPKLVKEKKGGIFREELIRSNPNYTGLDKECLSQMETLRMSLILPMVFKGDVLGFMGLGNKKSEVPFSSEDIELLKTLVNSASVAVLNALNYKEIEKLRDRLKEENVYLQDELKVVYNFDEIIGSSLPLKRVLKTIERVAPTDSTVFITGETGTGKELIARAIHNLSLRKERALIKVNCAAIPAGLIESELFGHERGAFTGAVQSKVGKFELADGGTLFLDEIGEMPLEVQSKLLRVLQDREFERVGGTKKIKVDVRILAATNIDVKKAVSEGKFRQDLFYRLNVVPLECPQLRERKSDIPMLVVHFIDKSNKKLNKSVKGISEDALEMLKGYHWPGNVRELENIIERAVVLCQGDTITAEAIPSLLATFQEEELLLKESLSEAVKSYKIYLVREALRRTGGNQLQAAKLLGLTRGNLSRLIKSLGLDRSNSI